ncbi:MAG: uracil-DNA glycosylase [Ignavibacteria bacterium]|nr:MAG: uracil-DNA glycosylase [Ignavibacteria bacterium]
MSSNFLNIITDALEEQKELFGDLLFDSVNFEKKNYPLQSSENQAPIVSEKVELNMDKNLFAEDFQNAENLDELNSKINKCLKCELGKTRTNFVFGVGNPNADIMLVGEAPGAEEDKQGIPFVGRAGKLLNDILKAIKFEREEVYIANILKCRPPGNRNPSPSEMETCIPYLYKQIELVKPKLILCLGLVAATGLLKVKSSLTKLRGVVHDVNGIKTMVTYHPAALLRNPNWKYGAWEDVQKFRKLYDEMLGVK